MSFLFLGDLHLGAYPKGVPASFTYLTSIFQQVEDYARIHGIENIVQLGDIHDYVGVEEDERIFLMEMLSKSQLNWISYYGNHDFESVEFNTFKYYIKMQKKFGLLKNVKFYMEPTVASLGKHRAAFLPWPHHSIKSKESLICFGHFAKAGAKGDTGYVLKNDVEISNKHFWIIGDLHTYQKGSNYVYIGAPLQLKYGDVDKRYFGHFTGTNEKPSYKRIPIKLPYRLEQITCLAEDKIESMLSNLKARDSNTYTKLKLGADVLADYRYEAIKNIERTTIEFAGKAKPKDEDEKEVVLIDSKSVRQELVKKRLIKKGFDKEAIKKALNLIKELESET